MAQKEIKAHHSLRLAPSMEDKINKRRNTSTSGVHGLNFNRAIEGLLKIGMEIDSKPFYRKRIRNLLRKA